ncbi:MAG: dihydrofolate reductase, partial [Candidatus Izimaplasma sp.]|nr:dihydrofolate reductase [Candidatus Izimaplasma bacterium]
LDLADRLYITHINKDFKGNVFFKEIDYTKYNKISERISGELTFSIYERIR